MLAGRRWFGCRPVAAFRRGLASGSMEDRTAGQIPTQLAAAISNAAEAL